MRVPLIFCFCALSCGCGYSHQETSSYKDHLFLTKELFWTKERFGKIQDVRRALGIREAIRQSGSSDKRFFITCEVPETSFLSPNPLPYGYIEVLVHLPPLRPNSAYELYCPLTGCPVQPEMVIQYRTDGEGNPVPAEIFDELQKNNIRISGPQYISLYANPGYCSDWYLMHHGSPFSVIHYSSCPRILLDESMQFAWRRPKLLERNRATKQPQDRYETIFHVQTNRPLDQGRLCTGGCCIEVPIRLE